MQDSEEVGGGRREHLVVSGQRLGGRLWWEALARRGWIARFGSTLGGVSYGRIGWEEKRRLTRLLGI